LAKQKITSPEDAVLKGLAKAFHALPDALPLVGTGSLFGKTGAEVADRAVAGGYLLRRDEAVGTGKKRKTVTTGVLTEAGIEKVLDRDSPKTQLEALAPLIERLGHQPPAPDMGLVRVELEKATAACVRAVESAVARMQQAVLEALPQHPAAVPLGPVLSAVRSAADRVKAPVRPAVGPTPLTTVPDHTSGPALDRDIQSFVRASAARTTVGCQFDALMNHLRAAHPRLSVGAFHDALRRLYDARGIRLGGWPKSIQELPDPDLALFVSHKVMYYAHPAD
jgi:hypothetical protein